MTKTSKFYQGFTLMEILVVISIIAMLSSILYAMFNPVRAQARDVRRKEDVHQIDVAIQEYVSDNGHAPYLSNCAALAGGNSTDQTSTCVASSNQGVNQSNPTPWTYLYNQLVPRYASTLPTDPCTTCSSVSGNSPGYTYVAPLQLQYDCGFSCSQSESQLDQSYKLYATLEKSVANYDSSQSASVMVPGDGDQGMSAVLVQTSPAGDVQYNVDDLVISWSSTGAKSCTIPVDGTLGIDSQDQLSVLQHYFLTISHGSGAAAPNGTADLGVAHQSDFGNGYVVLRCFSNIDGTGNSAETGLNIRFVQ